MATSRVKVVGRVEPPAGKSWNDVIASRAAKQLLVLDFHALTAKALGLPAREIQIHQRAWLGAAADRMVQEDWHRDAAKEVGHVLCSVGADTTEFLLGAFPDSYLEAEANDLAELEANLRFWRPDPGELVQVDRLTIHRRPACGERPRFFLLGAQA